MERPASPVPIRFLGADDAAAFMALRLKALSDAPEAFGATVMEDRALSAEAVRQRLVSPDGNAVVGAFAGADLIGMAGFAVGCMVKTRHRGTLWGVYVQPAWRGHGLARRLTQRIIDHARQRVMILDARVAMENGPARALYRRLGFKAYGVEPKALWHEGRFSDDELLFMDLSAEL